MRWALVGVTAALALLSVAAPPPAGASPPPIGDSIGVVPLDGAHWQAGAGLPDANGNAQIGMVQSATTLGHLDVARITGLDGLPTSALTSLGFAVAPLPSGIAPCWKVLFTGPDGTQTTVHLVASSDARGVTATRLGGGWTQWTWSPGTLPAGTIDQIIIGVMVSQTPPPIGDRVTFDNFTANGITATKGGQVKG